MENSYTGLAASLHDLFWATEGDPVELPLLDCFLTRHPGRALEVGCGSGRLLLPLCVKGHEVEGLDSSAEMLDLCRRSAADLGLDPVLHLGALERYSPVRRYRVLTVPAFTLQLAVDPAAALARFHEWLEPSGSIYLSVFLPLAEIHGDLPEGTWYDDHSTTLPDGGRASILTRHRIDLDRQVLCREHRHEMHRADGTLFARHESSQTLHWFWFEDLAEMLGQAGFVIDSALGDFDPEVTPEEAQIVTIEATRLS